MTWIKLPARPLRKGALHATENAGPNPHLPSGAGDLAGRFPAVWESYAQLGERCAEAGPLTPKARYLVKIALAAGSVSEGAVHSHVRRGMAQGLTPEEIEHVALLAIPTLGLPGAVRTMTWIGDIVKSGKKKSVR